MLPRVVVDTNVFVGACLGGGSANAVLAACIGGGCQPLMGAALFAEYEDVLARPALFDRAPLDGAERAELFDIFIASCEWTRVYFGWRPNLPDEADNHLIELAVAGGATCIVTRNLRDLQRAELKFPDVRILEPMDFIKELQR